MSRSYRKHPIVRDRCNTKYSKRLANRAVRNYLKNVDNEIRGKSYRKVFDSWQIHDYRFYKSKRQLIHMYESDLAEYYTKGYTYGITRNGKPRLKDYLRWWYKTYYKK